MRGILPLLGGVCSSAPSSSASVQYADPEYDGTRPSSASAAVFVLGIGALVLGAVLMLIYRATAPAFFAGDTLPRRGAHDLVLAGVAHEGESVRLPDSGLPEIVIRPDLSNLPEGATAIDPVTGEEFHRED